MPNSNKPGPWTIAASAVLALMICVLHSVAHVPSAGVAYVLVVWLMGQGRRVRPILITAVICSLLVLGATLAYASSHTIWQLLANAGLSLLAIWVTAYLCWRQQQTQAALASVHANLEQQVQERSQRLLAGKARMDLALQSASVGTWDWNMSQNRVVWDDYVHAVFGLEAGTFGGDYPSFEKLLLPEDRQRVAEEVKLALEGKAEFDMTFRVIWPDGSLHYVAGRGKVYRDTAGHPIHMTGVNWDVTDRRRAEEAARESEERLNLALKSSRVGTWSRDLVTGNIFWDDYLHPLFGLEPGGFTGCYEDFLGMLHPDDRQRVLQEASASIERDAAYDTEYRVVWPDGSLHWLGSRGQVYRDPDGRAVRMTGVCWDATAIKSAEAAVRASQERLNLALDSAEMGVVDLNLLSNTTWRTLTHDEIFGYAKLQSDWGFDDFLRHVLPEDRAAVQATVQQALVSRDLYLECRIVRTDQSIRWMCVQGRVYHDNTGQPVRLLGVVNDITQRKHMEKELQLAKEAAEAANLAKSSFLANMSHEIRTPMNGIIGMAQLLSQTDLHEQQRDYLLTINESAQILLRLLNDILDFSKIEAGKLELEKIDFRLSDCLARAAQMLSMRAEEKGLELTCYVAPEIPRYVTGDPSRLQQVIVNLLSNAVKFTESGHISIEANQTERDAESVVVHIAVSDTGIGIPSSRIERIFEAFEQAESSTTRRFGGSGLGLTISRQLVSLMGGRMWVDSQYGQGSIFHFTAQFGVPADQQERQPVDQLTSQTELENIHPRRVLLAEDNAINRRVASGLLGSRGHQVVFAENGREAVELSGAQEFDIILMDMQMPFMDGLEATHLIRERERQSGGRIPIVAMTANALKGDRERCLQAGMDDYVAKPVVPAEMFRAIERFPALCLAGEAGLPIPLAGSVAERTEQADEAVEADIQGSGQADIEGGPAIDWNQVREQLSDDPQLLRELIQIFRRQAPQLVNEISQAITAQDALCLRRAAHTLKGSAIHFGAAGLTQAAAELESAGRDSQFTDTGPTLARLEAELDRVWRALDQMESS